MHIHICTHLQLLTEHLLYRWFLHLCALHVAAQLLPGTWCGCQVAVGSIDLACAGKVQSEPFLTTETPFMTKTNVQGTWVRSALCNSLASLNQSERERGNLGNAQKKTFFFIRSVPLYVGANKLRMTISRNINIVTSQENSDSILAMFYISVGTKLLLMHIGWIESHQQKLTPHQDDDTGNNWDNLEGSDYLWVGNVVDGVKDDQVAHIGDGHEAEGDEGGQPNHLDCKVNQDHHCQGQFTKFHPEFISVFKRGFNHPPDNNRKNESPCLKLQQS